MPIETESTMRTTGDGINRRSFLGVLLAFGAAVMGAALSIPLLRVTLHPLLKKTAEIGWSTVGPMSDFASITAPTKRNITVEQIDGWRKIVSDKAVYVLPAKDGGAVRVLTPICPHLGCSVPWNEARQEFTCPCHAAVFGPDGAHRSGPSPRAMDELESKVEDGMLKVHYQFFRQLVATKEVLA